MPKKVIKRDKREEDFIPEKIVVSTLKAGAEPDTARKVAVYIEGNIGDKIDTKEIKDMIFKKLSEKYPNLKDKWKDYEKEKRK